MTKIVKGLATGLALLVSVAGCGSSEPSSRKPARTTTSAAVADRAETTSASQDDEGPDLAGLRPHTEEEACPRTLEILNSPDLPAEARDAFGFGFSGLVTDAGVIDVHGAPDRESFGHADSAAWLTSTSVVFVPLQDWQQRTADASPPPGVLQFSAEFERGPDGTYTCSVFDNVGGE